jgi:hypothetical protein
MSPVKVQENYYVCASKQMWVLPIPLPDWTSLKDQIAELPPARDRFLFWAGILFGIAGGALLALLTYPKVLTVDPWTVPATWALLFVGAISGFICLSRDNSRRHVVRTSAESLLRRMKELEERFVLPGNEPEGTGP